MSITSSNSIVMISIPGLFDVPQLLQGYSADDVFSTESINSAELSMGVDGVMSAGFVFVPIKQTFTLQADSLSNLLFDILYQSQQSIQEIYRIDGIIILPALFRKWSCRRGVLSNYPPLPDAGKTLKPRAFDITWESISGAPV